MLCNKLSTKEKPMIVIFILYRYFADYFGRDSISKKARQKSGEDVDFTARIPL